MICELCDGTEGVELTPWRSVIIPICAKCVREMIESTKPKPKVLVRCVNDKDRPADIPTTHWVVEGMVYTAIDCKKGCNNWYFILEEIDLKPFWPYEGFATNRFEEI